MHKNTQKIFNTLFKNNKPSNQTTSIGQRTETLACNYLLKNKLTLIERNYRCQRGEIDLIMRDHQSLVFVEVRYRKNIRFGTSLESISPYKLNRLKTAINHYTMTNNLGYIACRIDVIGLHGKLEQPNIQWLKNIITD